MKWLVSLCVLMIVLGCKKSSPLTYEIHTFSESDLSLCENAKCSTINLEYPIFSGTPEISNKINGYVEKTIIESLFLGEDENPSAKTIEEAAQQFILAYRDHKTEFELGMEYEAEISMLSSFQNEDLLSLSSAHYLYTGGAHGYGMETFTNFDLHSGEIMTIEKLFHDFEEFKSFAEKVFRKEQGIPMEGSINATGFWFENDQFYLPEHIGFTQGGLIFNYNPYDIASYAEGILRIEISWEEIQPFLSNRYF